MKRSGIGNLGKEFNYYLEHQTELVEKYNGKFIVIKDGKVLGAFASALEAVEKTTEQHELGTFLIQQCEPGNASYTQTYHSRVSV
ncbi:unnamed protein product [marine sediment metagenome]|uniref:DUF5678 domain-containing protein n=1 Tax=marine sediment metagenome TaxID=412755 RepID=X1SHC6_9ZZZZ